VATVDPDTDVPPAPAGVSVRAWRNAVFAVFALTGISMATWASRIPAVKRDLDVSTGGIAVLLFAIAAGSIVGLVLAPALLARFGVRRGLLVCVCTFAVALGVTGVAVGVLHSEVVAFLALLVFGFSYSATDVLMNVEGAEAERAIGKTVMPLMHAFFSVGTIVGAALGAAASAVALPVAWNYGLITVALVVGICVAIRYIPAGSSDASAGAGDDPAAPVADEPKPGWRERLHDNLQVWKDVRLLLVGVMMLGMAFTEGSANDWISLASVDGHGYSATTGALVYGTFVAAMTVGRVLGGPLIDRYGRVALLAVTAVIGIAGVLLFILSSAPVLIFSGAALWGLGGSLGFPVGVSAAADHPTDAARRVSLVAIFGYAAFLVGPPVLGFLGQHFGILNAFYVTVALLLLSLVTSRNARPAEPVDVPR
jgi:MFS family permease